MGKAGYLPDISGRFSQWTSYAIKSLELKNTVGASGGLNNMNALLDNEHRVSINTRQYNEKILSERFYLCNFCTEIVEIIINEGEEDVRSEKITRQTEIPYANIHVFDLMSDYMEYLITKKKTNKVWICPKCNKTNKLSNTNFLQPERENPFYLKVVPNPPIRTSGNRVGFAEKFRDWFNNYSEELENALMLYRTEYIALNGEDMADNNQFVDKGDR